MTYEDLQPHDRRYLDALADAYMEVPVDTHEEEVLGEVLDAACARLDLDQAEIAKAQAAALERANGWDTAYARLRRQGEVQ
jgi:hypothetical protein